jgi:RNA polymerase sigma-70 factor (ECF subfamily)
MLYYLLLTLEPAFPALPGTTDPARTFSPGAMGPEGRSAQIVKDPSKIPARADHAELPGSTSSGLLERVKAADPEAWKRLAFLYGPLVYRWCRERRLRAEDCEDVVQEVFLTVAARVGDFDCRRERGPFRGWLWTITRHKLGDWFRRCRKREQCAGGSTALRDLEALPEEEELSPSPDAAGMVELQHRVLDLIRSEFEERSWRAFWQVVIEGHNPADVAAELGMTRNAVYIAKSRILHRLHEVLGDE